MARHARITALALLPALLLAACGGSSDEIAGDGTEDGAAKAALGDEIMADPDLVGQNQANSALAAGGTASLPATALTPEAIANARAKAVNLVGGPGMIRKAPKALDVGALPADAALNQALRVAASADGANCADRAEYTMAWAAKLPKTFPVYPQGATQEAAGTDEGGCALRVVNFLTAVPLEDVMSFYYTRATNAGYSTQRAIGEGDDMLGGVKDGGSYVITARALPSGGTEVDLITHGG